MVGKNGWRVPRVYAGVSERRQESVVLCAARCWRRGSGRTVCGGVVSGMCVRCGRFQESEWVRLVKAYKGARRT